MYLISIKPTYFEIHNIRFEFDKEYSGDISIDIYKKNSKDVENLSITWVIKESHILVYLDFSNLSFTKLETKNYNIRAYKVEVDNEGVYIYTHTENKIFDVLNEYEDIDIIQLYRA